MFRSPSGNPCEQSICKHGGPSGIASSFESTFSLERLDFFTTYLRYNL